MTQMSELLTLVERYRDQFGKPPPIYWADAPDAVTWEMEQIRLALQRGRPWIRPELKAPKEILT